MSEETLDSLVRAELQRQRERLKGKRGAWSPVKTRNPLERLLEKETLGTNFKEIFDETLRLLREFSKTHAPPSSPHARPKYDRLMVVALLILKEMSPQPISFKGIRGRAIEAGIDMRVSGDARHRVPIAETLRYHYRNPRLRQ